ncbi:MAG: carbohydrate ABC transporter permease [Acidimicrobiales bacterium]
MSAAPLGIAGELARRWERSRLYLWVPLGLFMLFTLVPFYWMIVFAFRPDGSTHPYPWPVTLANFQLVWNVLGFGVFFKNSVLVGVGTLVGVNVISALSGYALARFSFRGRGFLVVGLLCTQFVPGVMLLIPLFIIFRHLGLIDNLLALVIGDTVFQLPLTTLLMSGFIRSVPVELEEAAMVDGCSRLKAFRAVTLPLLRPAFVAIGSFAFVGSWNNFLFALIFMNSQDHFTLPVGLDYTIGEFSVNFGALAAGGVLAAVPVVIVFAIVQRYLVQGLTVGAIKG